MSAGGDPRRAALVPLAPPASVRVTWIGHSTALIDLDSVRLLTDPVLRSRTAHIVRHASAVDLLAIGDVDLVLVSHMHYDHFDPKSLRLVEGRPELIVPRGAGRGAVRRGFGSVSELAVGERLERGPITITATPANHARGRLIDRHSEAIGFKIVGTQGLYFAGDTGRFPEMRQLRGGLDLALLPVGGWGPKLGAGHLSPKRTAESLLLLQPRIAVPIHWGTLHRLGMRKAQRATMGEAARDFSREAARLAPSVEIRVLQPGESTLVEPAVARAT
jgi:L-ascorbate metabolism protein UlaG (beta-lactamase superfamily)